MKRKLLLISALAMLLIAFLSIGPDAPGQAGEPPPPATEAPAAEPPDTTPLETFEPTEKLPADSAISFPVDI